MGELVLGLVWENGMNLFTVILLSILNFGTTYYQHRMDGSYSGCDVVFDIILSIITIFMFYIIFTKDKNLFCEGAFSIHKEHASYLFIVFFSLKIVMDVLIFIFGLMSVEWKYIGSGLVSVGYIIFAYAAFVDKDFAIWKNKRSLLTWGGFILLVCVIGVCYDFYLIEQTHLLSTKYVTRSPFINYGYKNLDFFSSIKSFIVDTVVWGTLIIFHTTRTQKTNKEVSDTGKARRVVRFLVRCELVVLFFGILFFAKISVEPSSTLLYKIPRASVVQNYEEGEEHFDCRVEEIMVLHGFETKPESINSYYCAKRMTLKKNNCKLEKFTYNYGDPAYVFTEQGDAVLNYVKFTIQERQVYLYGHYAICYYENGTTPRIIRIDSLKECENNSIVTELCKILIEDGNIFAFEYGAKYLLKYDASFIKPYIERYASGDFDESEAEWMEESYYRSEYIVNLAKSYLELYK